MGAATAAHHYATINPYTGEVVQEFESLDSAEADRAVETARSTASSARGTGASCPISGCRSSSTRS
jgi:acyl-CoA reductase-like NAD-dependent aldehyde dehydrogenase